MCSPDHNGVVSEANRPTGRCRAACATKDHSSFCECVRAAGIQMAPVDIDNKNKRWDSELHAYREVRRQGMQPKRTTMAEIEAEKRRMDA